MRVANETRGWVEGEAHLFDDSFEHEAWNGSERARLLRAHAQMHVHVHCMCACISSWALHACRSEQPRLIFVVDVWHPELIGAQRLRALDERGQQRFRAVMASLRARRDLPVAERDAHAERRTPAGAFAYRVQVTANNSNLQALGYLLVA